MGRAGGELASGSPSSSLSSRGWRSHGDPAVPLFTCHSVPQTSPPAPSPEPWSPRRLLLRAVPGTLQSGGRQVQTVRGRGFPRQPPAPPPRSHTLPRSAPLPARPAPRRPPGPPRGPDRAPPRTPGFCEHHPLPVSLVLTRSRVTFPQLLPLHLTNLTARLLQISFYYGPASQSN